jgi:transcriptional regulator with XRE-family HTH domain
MSQFGDRLRELRTAAGLSLRGLAERAGVTPDAIVKLESGNRSPSWDTALALAGALGVSCEAFTQPAAGPAPEPKRGRPPKAPPEPPAEPEPKRPRGRPRKEK